MSKILSCHQVNYFPNKNYFDKIKASDIFVMLDDVQFEKNGFTNRNKIPNGINDLWLTIPIIHKAGQLIKDVKTTNDLWKEKHRKTLLHKYKDAEFINSFFDYNSDNLVDWTARSIIFVVAELEIDFKIIRSSQLEIFSTGTQRLVDICEYFHADTYLSGQGAKKYMDIELFNKAGIKVEFMPEKHEPYSIINSILNV
jgi:hypothetical protein